MRVSRRRENEVRRRGVRRSLPVTKLYELVDSVNAHYAWMFHCPGCNSIHQCDTRWTFNGSQTAPTFRASILVHGAPDIGRPQCHSFVTDGRIEFLGDCTHALAGQTVDLPDWAAHHPDWVPGANGTAPRMP